MSLSLREEFSKVSCIANHSGTLTSYVGGIVSYNEGTLKSTTNNLNVSGGTYAAGICAYDLSTSSAKAGTYLINNGLVLGKTAAGGVYGYSKQLVFDYMKNSGSITATNYAGGIVGVNTASHNNPIKVNYCANTGNITSTNNSQGSSYAGGITSNAYEILISDSYNTGSITGFYRGGLVGYNIGEGSYIRCFNTSSCGYGFSIYMGSGSVIQDSITFGATSFTMMSHVTITNSYSTKPSNNSFYIETLFWSEEVWNVPTTGNPTLCWENLE